VCSHPLDYSTYPGLFFLNGRRCRNIIVLVPSDNQVEPAKVQMNKCIDKNLYVFLDDIVSIFSRSDCLDCTRIALIPFKDPDEGFSGDLFDISIRPDFTLTYRPIRKLDTFTVEF
jgi:hypothetical protein